MGQLAEPSEKRIGALLSRALVVDDKFSRRQFTADLLRHFNCEVRKAPDLAAGRAMAIAWDPQLIVVSHEDCGLDGVAFTRDLRRSGLACRRAAVIILLAQPTGALIVAGRDAGAHEFLVHPVRAADLARRLETALLRPRAWVETTAYVGPDRRHLLAGYTGRERRLAKYRKGGVQGGLVL